MRQEEITQEFQRRRKKYSLTVQLLLGGMILAITSSLWFGYRAETMKDTYKVLVFAIAYLFIVIISLVKLRCPACEKKIILRYQTPKRCPHCSARFTN